jgi:hypothetical protein
MAIASMPQLDTTGGLWGQCDGPFLGEPHGFIQIDHLGEPFDPARYAEIVAALAKWNEPIVGHSLTRVGAAS